MDYTIHGVAKNLDRTERISLSLYTLFRFLIVLCYSVFFFFPPSLFSLPFILKVSIAISSSQLFFLQSCGVH